MNFRTLLLLTAALLVALPASIAWSNAEAAARQLPDGEVAPVIYSVHLSDPQAHNELLEADLEVLAHDADGVDRYEYRWNRSTVGSTASTPAADATVSFASLQPETRYVLEVRAVDINGWASDWVFGADVVSPKPPALIIAGDSVASGYQRQWFTSKGDCLDREYSYGSTVHRELSDSLPSQWAPTYRNVAWAGAGLHSMANGGSDSCGDHHESQLDAIVNAADPSTWNIVVATGGINSTNWSRVVAGLTKDTAFSFSERGDQQACSAAVSDKWDLPDKTDSVAQAASRIASTLSERTNASLFWTSYYTLNGSKLAPGWTPIGTECNDEMSTAMALLHDTLKRGLGDQASWIDIDLGTVATQDWGGWPHPDERGHERIGLIIASKIG